MIWMGFQRRAAYLPLILAVRQTLVRHLSVARSALHYEGRTGDSADKPLTRSRATSPPGGSHSLNPADAATARRKWLRRQNIPTRRQLPGTSDFTHRRSICEFEQTRWP